jgi:hypothetical protein
MSSFKEIYGIKMQIKMIECLYKKGSITKLVYEKATDIFLQRLTKCQRLDTINSSKKIVGDMVNGII